MIDQIPDIVGKKFQYKDDLDRDVHAVVMQSFGLHGGKSYIFHGMIEGSDEKIIIKYPRAGEKAEEEYGALDKIKKTDAKGNVPSCWLASIDDKKVLVMELLPKSRQWQTLKFEKTIKPSEVINGLSQAISLTRMSHKQGIINTDLKIENCFWLEGGRFVLLDWNKYIKISHHVDDEQKDQYENLKRQNYRILVNFAYYMLCGENVINPLPDIHSSEPESWQRCPYVIRKIMHELQDNTKPYSYEEIILELDSLQNLLKLKEDGDFERIIEEAEKDLQTGVFTITILNEVENILSLLPEKLPNQLVERRQIIKQRMRDETAQKEQVLQNTEQEIIAMLADRRAEAALKTAEAAVQNILLTNDKKWNLVKILSLSKVMYDMIDGSVYITNHDAEILSHSLENPMRVKQIEDSHVKKRVEELCKVFEEADEWIHKMGSAIESNYEGVLKLRADFKDWWGDIQAQKIMHDEARVIFLSLIPDWDYRILENSIHIREKRKGQNEMVEKFIKSLENALIQDPSNAMRNIDEILGNADDEMMIEPIYEVVNYLQDDIRAQNWVRALQRIAEKQIILGNELTRLYKKHISTQLDNWLRSIEGRLKFRKELLSLTQIMKFIEPDSSSYQLVEKFQDHINVFMNADRESRDSLEACIRMQIEPWMETSDDDILSVDSFLRLLNIRDYKKTLDECRSGFKEQLALSPEIIKEIREKAESEEHEVAELQRQFNEMNRVIEDSEQAMNKITSEGKRKIQDLFARINKEYPNSLRENPYWWNLLVDGKLDELENEIREYRQSSTDTELIAMNEWEDRLKQVKELSEFQLLLQNLKKKPDFIIEHEALLRIIFPNMMWEAAKNYLNTNN